MNNPVHNKDTTPLWGGAQYSYPDHSRSPGPSTSWADHPGSSHPMAHHHSFDPYQGLREDINYTELKSENSSVMSEPDSVLPDAYPRAMAYIQHQQQYQHQQQQQLSAGGAPPIPQENPPYLQSLAAFQENRSSPDLGYSSPPPAPEFFGAHYQPRGQVAGGEFPMSSYHQNVISPGEPPMRHVPVKEESVDTPVSYSKQLELIVKHVDENKPIIHANIQICPPYKFDQTSQMQSYPQQQQGMQPEPFSVNIVLPQQTPRVEQSSQNNTETHDQYDPMESDEQPAKRRAVIVSPPKRATPKKSPAKARKSPPKKSLTPSERRAVRPSGINHSDFQCLKCGEYFARKCGLTQHDKWIHTKRDHQCITCGKFFFTKEQLEKHEVRHEQVDKAFKCDECEKQYCHKNDLRRHKYRHSMESPYMCKICPSMFGRADHLTNHIASHERKAALAAEREAMERDAEEREAAEFEAAMMEGRSKKRKLSRGNRD